MSKNMPSCRDCQHSFSVSAQDQKFYEKIGVPEPAKCPRCRQQQRLAFRNEINFHRRKSDFSGKEILTVYATDQPYPIYDQEEWWSDKWDPLKYGREFDFSRPFFEQFQEMRLLVPRMSLNNVANENSYYTNYALKNKNSYLVTTADFNEDCYYGRFSDRNFRCMDFDFTYDSRFCFEVINVHRSQTCFFSEKLDGCSDNYFCYDMRNCHNCIFSANQRNQSYMVFNKKVTVAEFAALKQELGLSSRSGVAAARVKADEFLKTQPRKYLEMMQCEDSVGDYLKNCKNALFCFDGYDLHDVSYSSIVFKAKDCCDWDFVGDKSERCYNMVSCANNLHGCMCCMNVWDDCSDVFYSDLCLFSHNLFGCVGLRRMDHCILNVKYKKEAFDKLRLTIIEHMKKMGEWGEFFPASISPFPYNESVADEYYPLSKEEALAAGFLWRDADLQEYKPQSAAIPDDIKDVQDLIVNEIFSCEACRKNFKIIPQELKFCREMKLPLSTNCWVCRHKTRMARRNPRVVTQRNCGKCGTQILTTYAQDRPEPVYCENCYLNYVS